jgi:hypothetical protein
MSAHTRRGLQDLDRKVIPRCLLEARSLDRHVCGDFDRSWLRHQATLDVFPPCSYGISLRTPKKLSQYCGILEQTCLLREKYAGQAGSLSVRILFNECMRFGGMMPIADTSRRSTRLWRFAVC